MKAKKGHFIESNDLIDDWLVLSTQLKSSPSRGLKKNTYLKPQPRYYLLVDGKNPANRLSLVVYQFIITIYKGLVHPRWVVQDYFHQPCHAGKYNFNLDYTSKCLDVNQAAKDERGIFQKMSAYSVCLTLCFPRYS